MDRIVELINKDSMSSDDRLELLDELYWADFSKLKSDYPEGINKILLFLREEDFSIGSSVDVIYPQFTRDVNCHFFNDFGFCLGEREGIYSVMFRCYFLGTVFLCLLVSYFALEPG